MGKAGGITLIVIGAIILLNVIIMAIGGLKAVMGIMMPIGFKFIPLNEKLLAWIDVPLSMGLEAYMFSVQALDEEGYLGGGIIDFKVILSSGGPEDSDIEAVPVVFIQEDAEIDEIQRYVLRAGPLNYPSIIFWFLSIGSFGGFITAIIRRVKMRGMGSGKQKEAVAPEPPPDTVVSVIPLEDEEKE